MIETLREVRSREYQNLWQRVPGTVGTLLWMVMVGSWGWDTGVWAGATLMALLTVLTHIVPSSWRPVELLVDLAYPTAMRSTLLRLLWLLLIVDLWVLQSRGPWSIPMVLALFLGSMVIPFATRRLLKGLAGQVRPAA